MLVTLWAFQTQLLPQIIANRIGLIMVNNQKARYLKIGLFVGIGAINISVYYIWITAQMQDKPRITHLNFIWEHFEKTFFLVVDLALNLYFLYLVRSRLISRGLTKYWRLYNFNAAIIMVSTSMDILLLGLMSLPNTYEYVFTLHFSDHLVPIQLPIWFWSIALSQYNLILSTESWLLYNFSYVQFAPVAYTVKLNIELSMADLISKVVRSSYRDHSGNFDSNRSSDNTHTVSRPHSYFPGSAEKQVTARGYEEDEYSNKTDREKYDGEGIVKTVTVMQTEKDKAWKNWISVTIATLIASYGLAANPLSNNIL